jgi:NAD(P)-dependent dehydrogenase (short-subunit alcohol dehydrogenase family)
MARSYDVSGRTVFITGAARGIGAGSAERLHGLGANVALVGLEPERLEALAAKLGPRALAVEADVTSFDALQDAVRQTVERFGGIDVAIANAGIHNAGALATMDMAAAERTLEVNLLGVFRTDRAVLPELIRSRGYLLNVSSLSAVSHAPLMGPYTAAKAGVEAMTDTLRTEMIPAGVGVGCAYFGFIDTDLTRGSFEEASAGALRGLMPRYISKMEPLSAAVDAVERGVTRRLARTWAPRWVGAAIAVRGVMQPLADRRVARSRQLREAMRLAEEEARTAAADGNGSLLGVGGAYASRPPTA